MTPAGEAFAAAIDGEDGASWRLPLQPLNSRSTPEAYSPGEQPQVDRLEAAARLVSCSCSNDKRCSAAGWLAG
jgi:glutathione S-transferase